MVSEGASGEVIVAATEEDFEEDVGEDATLQAELFGSLTTSSRVAARLLANSVLLPAEVLLAVLLATDRTDAATLVARGESREGDARQLLRGVRICVSILDEYMPRMQKSMSNMK